VNLQSFPANKAVDIPEVKQRLLADPRLSPQAIMKSVKKSPQSHRLALAPFRKRTRCVPRKNPGSNWRGRLHKRA